MNRKGETMRKTFNGLIFLVALLLAFSSPVSAQLATSAVSGIVYDATGAPLASIPILFNVPQQTIAGEVVGPGLVSAITDAKGNLSINLPRQAIVQITISTGMPIQGIVPDSATSTFVDVLTGTHPTPLPWNLTGPITSVDKATSIASQTGTGTKFVVDTSPTIVTPTISGAVSFQDGVRQTFNPNGTTPGVNVGANAGDPSTPSNGDLWYDSTGNLLRARINSATVSLGAGGGGVTAVTASVPLASSGGGAPNITLPHVIIAATNTAIGTSSLSSNTTGTNNTASGANALPANTTGTYNTASGANALPANTTGYQNTAIGALAMQINTTGFYNTAIGLNALLANSTGSQNTAIGLQALQSNTTGTNNTAIGFSANVSTGNLTNATAIGANASVNASNKIRLGDANVTVIEGQVDFTFISDQTKKENFQPVDGEEVLRKIRDFNLTSWNYIGHDPKQFRHYGPMAQDFFAAFGQDGIGTIGTPTTLSSGDMVGILMIAVQTLEKQNRDLKARLENLERIAGR